jgi:hypothetical protein
MENINGFGNFLGIVWDKFGTSLGIVWDFQHLIINILTKKMELNLGHVWEVFIN